jgi:peroxiredoxin
MDLEHRLPDSAEKEAISVLHAMIQESRRSPAFESSPSGRPDEHSSAVTLEDIASLYKSAPGMGGQAENPGLPAGFAAPNFSLQDSTGKAVSLDQFRGKNVVLVFYPLDWSPACSDQLSLYQSELEEFTRLNTQVVALSVDSLYSHGAWVAVRGITFPLLADFNPKGEIARRYQVYRDSDGFSERALFVIDPQGMIRHTTISPELPMIPDIYQLFEQLEALQAEPAAGQAPGHNR